MPGDRYRASDLEAKLSQNRVLKLRPNGEGIDIVFRNRSCQLYLRWSGRVAQDEVGLVLILYLHGGTLDFFHESAEGKVR